VNAFLTKKVPGLEQKQAPTIRTLPDFVISQGKKSQPLAAQHALS